MNDQLREDAIDREISRFLAFQARDVADAPSATEMAALLAGSAARTRAPRLGMTPQLAWIVLAGLLVLSLIGAMVVGANLLREDPVAVVEATATPQTLASYEAVFLRRDPPEDVLVIGVDSEGRDRVITRLTKAWSNDSVAPAGAISPTGLLAMPAGLNPGALHWTIFDVLRPEATAIVIAGITRQDIDQISYWYPIGLTSGTFSPDARAWWGPGDRLAIHWYERIPVDGGYGRNYFMTFADGTTGEATSFDIHDDLEFRPYWAPDGSGILVQTSADSQVLRVDGTLAPASDAVPETSCGRLPQAGSDLDTDSDDETTACLSPDGALVARGPGWAQYPTGSLTVQATGESFGVVGRFAGWLQLDP